MTQRLSGHVVTSVEPSMGPAGGGTLVDLPTWLSALRLSNFVGPGFGTQEAVLCFS